VLIPSPRASALPSSITALFAAFGRRTVARMFAGISIVIVIEQELGFLQITIAAQYMAEVRRAQKACGQTCNHKYRMGLETGRESGAASDLWGALLNARSV
jgi:hypothetical protein